MIKGYDDDGPRVKIVHWPLKSLLQARRNRESFAGIRWPYTTRSANGWDPFKRRQR